MNQQNNNNPQQPSFYSVPTDYTQAQQPVSGHQPYQEQPSSVQFSMAPQRGGLRGPVLTVLAFTAATLLVGTGVYYGFFAGSDQGDVPVVEADATPIKTVPVGDARGGAEIPNKDSTIFAGMRGEEGAATENILVLDAPLADVAQPVQVAPEPTPVKPAAKVVENPPKKKEVQSLLEMATAESKPAEPAAAKPSYAKPETLHPAGSSPETIAFVKSVLNKAEPAAAAPAAAPVQSAPKAAVAPKAVPQAVPKVAPKVAPKVSASTAPAAAVGGTHYVQLASVSSREGADAEWPKLQAKHADILAGAGYRVDAADLGARGVFYRIQAGPFSKGDASAKCAAIKAKQPGGCLVVAK